MNVLFFSLYIAYVQSAQIQQSLDWISSFTEFQREIIAGLQSHCKLMEYVYI